MYYNCSSVCVICWLLSRWRRKKCIFFALPLQVLLFHNWIIGKAVQFFGCFPLAFIMLFVCSLFLFSAPFSVDFLKSVRNFLLKSTAQKLRCFCTSMCLLLASMWHRGGGGGCPLNRPRGTTNWPTILPHAPRPASKAENNVKLKRGWGAAKNWRQVREYASRCLQARTLCPSLHTASGLVTFGALQRNGAIEFARLQRGARERANTRTIRVLV